MRQTSTPTDDKHRRMMEWSEDMYESLKRITAEPLARAMASSLHPLSFAIKEAGRIVQRIDKGGDA